MKLFLTSVVVPVVFGRSSQLFLFVSVVVTVLGSVLTWSIFKPSTGFDDANITMNFAQNIANGEGYVYYVGGELVEGSSSALWTFINTVLYLVFDDIEVPLSILGALISATTIQISILISWQILRNSSFQEPAFAGLTGVAFLFFPSYFAYMVWSLMDIGLFILLVCAMIYCQTLVLQSAASRSTRLFFIVFAALLSAARPEGVAFAISLSILLWLGLLYQRRHGLYHVAFGGILFAILTVSGLTILRLWYFGQPLPNTFYAKVSTSYGSQLLEGVKYSINYFYDFANIALVSLFLLSISVLPRKQETSLLWMTSLACGLCAFAIYSGLGGDHFGSFRFYQVLTPVLLPWAVAAVVMSYEKFAPQTTGWRSVVGFAAAVIVLVAAWGQFKQTKGGLDVDFSIAQAGRDMGNILNEFDPLPSVGILTAGGISMTYEGEIYDLLGLNWVEMAHSNRSAMRVKNNSGFSEVVFWNNTPDIILPEIRDCNQPAMNYEWVMDDVVASERFSEMYSYECYKGLTFYKKKDVALPSKL